MRGVYDFQMRLPSRSNSWVRWLDWTGLGGQVGAREVGVSGEGSVLLAIHQEAYMGDEGQVGVESCADGKHGERLGFKA